jgi:DmsE family decaheme c-type cytochrome
MDRLRFFPVFATLLGAGLALLWASTAVETAPAAQAPEAVKTARVAQAAPVAQAGFVGEETCLGCHEDQKKGYADTAHGRAVHPRSPAASQGCETCHGPGEKHIEDPSVPGSIVRFASIAPREANATCLSCHARDQRALWEGSAHDTRNLPCVTCHSVHEFKSAKAQLKTKTEAETCASCHRLQTQKILRVGHMPVVEGKMECSSCHNPHGSTNVRQLKVGNWINESCVSCHAEKRGPFLFEHAAGRESCITCHDPHGSSNDRMLVAKLPMLCQRCHIGTRHPSTIYDNRTVLAKSNRIIGRGCVNCHQNIHGSNHPSGQTFLR